MRDSARWLLALTVLILTSRILHAEQLEIPRRHDRPPGEPISADEAARKMTVPEGFSVEVVAAEPDVINPVSMCIDEKGRFWVTESFEYPRREAGPGRDRVKTLEDTDGDGKVDKVTVFAEGLNIPSGVAVGYGGVWVLNSPDLLFMQDTDGDGKADKTEVIVTGFGRTDTHELPNSLTWGPDGWLYGLNGVFNYSKVSYSPTNPNFRPNRPSLDFTAALYRIHPRTKEFQIFAEGTSNPWGIAINGDGDFFISACVIDHLWHIVETGYYIRQGGPYPPHTWPIRSIVDHKHQKAAYCGIVWFDSDAYPEEYRNVLYMGNIHGGCLNADIVQRSGSSYKGKPHPGFPPKPGAWDNDKYGLIARTGDPNNPKLADFLTANDAWFMPVAQKIGPDGCLYVLDWYDRYHCYQDANADPAGIERAKGRLYRVRYQETPHTKPFDLNQKSDDELIALLGSKNIYFRETAQRLLSERGTAEIATKLLTVLVEDTASRTQKIHAMFAVAGIPDQRNKLSRIVGSIREPVFQSWATRFAFEAPEQRSKLEQLQEMTSDGLSEGRVDNILQRVIGVSKLKSHALPVNVLLTALEHPQCDVHLQQIVWRNLIPRIQAAPQDFISAVTKRQSSLPACQPVLARAFTMLCEHRDVSGQQLADLLVLTLNQPQITDQSKQDSLNSVITSARTSSLDASRLQALVAGLKPLAPSSKPIAFQLNILQALSGDPQARALLRSEFADNAAERHLRLAALQTLAAIGDKDVVVNVGEILSSRQTDKTFLSAVIDTCSKMNDPRIATLLVANVNQLEPDLQPRVIEVLTQRPAGSLALLKEIDAGRFNKTLINQNQLGRMNSFKEDELKQLITRHFGAIRSGVRQDRQQAIGRTRDFLHGSPGDPTVGATVFKKTCAQCHKIYGEGADVGPEITRNGRNDWNQLLQNVLDPSAVIGPGYQARIVATEDGRVLTGLPVEDSAERLVLKLQGGKLETIPKNEIEVDKLSELSLMPDELEKTMSPQELADLFAFLALDQPPENPDAKILPGAPQQKRR